MSKLYHILEISHRATQEEIKASYRRLVKLYHPDTSPDPSQEKLEHFQKIRQAYDILSDPAQRSYYDKGQINDHGKKPKILSSNHPILSVGLIWMTCFQV